MLFRSHIKADATSGDCQFIVYEVKPAGVTVSYPAAILLAPLAITSDVVAVGTMVAAPVALGAAGVMSVSPGFIGMLGKWGELDPVKQLRNEFK